MKKIDSPAMRERFVSKGLIKRSILLSVLIHLFVMIAVPTYSVRAIKPKLEKIPYVIDDDPIRRIALHDPWQSDWIFLLEDITEDMLYDKQPILIDYNSIEYPDLAIRAGIEGIVYTQILVGEDGHVKGVIPKGSAIFRGAAIEFAKHALFKPAMNGNSPVTSWIEIPIKFSLSAVDSFDGIIVRR